MENRPSKREQQDNVGSPKMAEPELPQLTKLRDFDRQQHIQKAIEMGMSREEAERHADHDLADRDEGEPTTSGAPGWRPVSE